MTQYKSSESTPVNDILKGKPHGWIQFKGTELCMDVHCKCGELTHIDGMFVYFLKCASCGTVYELNGNIELIERDSSEIGEDVCAIKETDL
jgi:hypothetical protein